MLNYIIYLHKSSLMLPGVIQIKPRGIFSQVMNLGIRRGFVLRTLRKTWFLFFLDSRKTEFLEDNLR